MKFGVVLNEDGGTLRTMDLKVFTAQIAAVFEAEGHSMICRVASGDGVEAALMAFARDDAIEAVVAGGGDGTISAAATIAFENKKPLAVLPAGTMNLFARALGMPLDLDAALLAIAQGQVQRVDIATANGRPFVHQFGVGIHARLVRIRNGMTYRGRAGKMMASLRAVLAAATNPPKFEVELHTGDAVSTRTASGIAVSNNPLDNGPVPVAARLDTGMLGVYVAGPVSTNEMLRLAVDLVLGRWRDNAVVSEIETGTVTLRFPKRKRGTHAVIDGELIDLAPVVHLKAHPQGLSVVLPKAK